MMKKMILSLIFGFFLTFNLSFAQPNLETLEEHYEDQIEAMGLSEAEEERLEDQMEAALYGDEMMPDFEGGNLSFGHCEINGKEIPCEEFPSEVVKALQNIPVFKSFLSNPEHAIKTFIWLGIVSIIITVLCFAFWLRMFIDVINHQKESKELWIIALIFGNLLAAIIYYFSARKKRKQAEKLTTPEK